MSNEKCLSTCVKKYLGKFYNLYEPGMTLNEADEKIKEHLVKIQKIVTNCFGNKYNKICAPGIQYTDALMVFQEEPDINKKNIKTSQNYVEDNRLEALYPELFTN